MVVVGSGCFDEGWVGYSFVVNFKIEDHGNQRIEFLEKRLAHIEGIIFKSKTHEKE